MDIEKALLVLLENLYKTHENSASKKESVVVESFLKNIPPILLKDEFKPIMQLFRKCSAFRQEFMGFMGLLDGCDAFKEAVLKTKTLPPLTLNCGGADISRCKISLAEAVSYMPLLRSVSISAYQLSLVKPEESYPDITRLQVAPSEKEIVQLHRISSLESFPNLRSFWGDEADDCIFVGSRGFSTSLTSLRVITEGADLDLRSLSNLNDFQIIPHMGDGVHLSGHVREIHVDLKKCMVGMIYMNIESYDRLIISNQNSAAVVRVHIPNGTPHGIIEMDEGLRLYKC